MISSGVNRFLGMTLTSWVGPDEHSSWTKSAPAGHHPSSDPTPSQEDRVLTQRLRQAGEFLGITLLDHLVLGEDRHVSFADQGWLSP